MPEYSQRLCPANEGRTRCKIVSKIALSMAPPQHAPLAGLKRPASIAEGATRRQGD